MNLYLVRPQLVGKYQKTMLFNLVMGAGNMTIIISNKLFKNLSIMCNSIQYEGLSFVCTTPPIIDNSGVNTYLQYLYEFKEYNEYIIPKDMMIFAVPQHEVTDSITSLFNGDYFRFFILDNASPRITQLFNNYPYCALLWG